MAFKHCNIYTEALTCQPTGAATCCDLSARGRRVRGRGISLIATLQHGFLLNAIAFVIDLIVVPYPSARPASHEAPRGALLLLLLQDVPVEDPVVLEALPLEQVLEDALKVPGIQKRKKSLIILYTRP